MEEASSMFFPLLHLFKRDARGASTENTERMDMSLLLLIDCVEKQEQAKRFGLVPNFEAAFNLDSHNTCPAGCVHTAWPEPGLFYCQNVKETDGI